MKYDDASWHYGGDFPKGLPDEAGATHTGMFVAWALLGELGNPEDPIDVTLLTTRRQTPGEFFFNELDGKFVDVFLSAEGNLFTETYFDFSTGSYLGDYEALFASQLPTTYHVADSWDNFDALKPVLDARFTEWKSKLNS